MLGIYYLFFIFIYISLNRIKSFDLIALLIFSSNGLINKSLLFSEIVFLVKLNNSSKKLSFEFIFGLVNIKSLRLPKNKLKIVFSYLIIIL